jgi:hypothetical protein
VLIEHLGENRWTEILDKPRRALDIREQEGHGSGGQGPIGHGSAAYGAAFAGICPCGCESSQSFRLAVAVSAPL